MSEQLRINSQVNVCQTCGDIGFKELLVCCSKCQISMEHRYCLHKIPEADDMEFFKYTCAHCVLTSARETSQKQSSQYVTRNRSFRRRKHERLVQYQKKGQVNRTFPVTMNSEVRKHESPRLQTSLYEPFVKDTSHPNIGIQPATFGRDLKTRPLTISSSLEEVEAEVQTQSTLLSLQTSDPRSDVQTCCISPLQTSVSKALVESKVQTHLSLQTSDPGSEVQTRCISPLQTSISKPIVEAEVRTQSTLLSLQTSGPSSEVQTPLQTSVSQPLVKDVLPEAYLGKNIRCLHKGDPPAALVQDLKMGLVRTSSSVEGIEAEVQAAGIPPSSQSLNALLVKDVLPEANLNENKTGSHCFGVNGGDVQELKRNNRGLVHADCGKSDEEVPYAQPIIDPVWRGCFEFSREKFGSLVAHLSNKACLRVVEAAKLMPKVLCIKMLSRLEVWPKSFNVSAPTDGNIALYFFPGSESSVKGYDLLVNHIVNRDLALKVLLDSAELLAFPSIKLPLQYRRFSGKYYLWGVFRGRQELSVHESVDTHGTQVSSTGCPLSLSALGIYKSDSPESLRMSPLSPLNLSASCASDSSCSPMPERSEPLKDQTAK